MDGTSPIVLIVDDHEDSAAMYAIGLLAMGFQPLVARTAEEAWVSVCELRPDVVVADITLPGISGLEFTRRLRQDVRTRDMAIVVLTGHSGDGVKHAAAEAGCDRFVVKPCLPDTLALEIRDLLLNRQQVNREPAPRLRAG
jgi:two-component system, cell cycle response regulator DivK